LGGTASAIANTADDPVYQTQRWGQFSYAIPLAQGTYEVTLQFNELYWTAADSRVFGATIENAPKMFDFDIFRAAGAANTAFDMKYSGIKIVDGQLNIDFTSSVDWAALSGIVIRKTATVETSLAVAINVGGPAYTATNGITYIADAYYTGGYIGSTDAEIGNTTEDPVYRDERWGTFDYAIPMPNGNYDVVLQFNELYWQAEGSRRFSATIEGSRMLYDFDIYRIAGANTAVDVNFGNMKVADGVLNLRFEASVDAASLSGIVVKRTSTTDSSTTNPGPISGTDTIAPTAPSNLKTSNVLNKQLTLTWGASTDAKGVTGYYVFRNGAQVGYVGGTVLTYTDMGLTPDTTYTYTVRAADAAGNQSAYSTLASVKTLQVAGSVTLSWTQPTERANGERIYATDIGGYEIRYKLRSASTYTSVKLGASTTSHSLSNLKGDYDFEVSVFDVSGNYSDYVRAAP
jgi:hypothetical protein